MKEICLEESSFLKVFVSGIPNLHIISNEEMEVMVNSLDVEIDKIMREFDESDRN